MTEEQFGKFLKLIDEDRKEPVGQTIWCSHSVGMEIHKTMKKAAYRPHIEEVVDIINLLMKKLKYEERNV